MTSKRLLDPITRILLDAADYIEQNGLNKGEYYGRTIRGRELRPACVLGAIRAFSDDEDLVKAAMAHFRHSIVIPIPVWNDDPKRTAEEVVAKLRSSALEKVN